MCRFPYAVGYREGVHGDEVLPVAVAVHHAHFQLAVAVGGDMEMQVAEAVDGHLGELQLSKEGVTQAIG